MSYFSYDALYASLVICEELGTWEGYGFDGCSYCLMVESLVFDVYLVDVWLHSRRNIAPSGFILPNPGGPFYKQFVDHDSHSMDLFLYYLFIYCLFNHLSIHLFIRLLLLFI